MALNALVADTNAPHRLFKTGRKLLEDFQMGNRVDLRRALPLDNIAKMRRYALESVWRTEFGSSVDFSWVGGSVRLHRGSLALLMLDQT